MSFVHHTTDAVQSSLLRSPGFWLPTLLVERRAHGKLVKDAVVLQEYMALQLSVCHSRLRSVSEDCASTLEKHGSLSTGDRKRVASIASPALTLKPRNLQFDTSAWCCHPDACSGNFGQSTSWKLSR